MKLISVLAVNTIYKGKCNLKTPVLTKERSSDNLMTVRQVAKFLQVSICSVRRWSDNGKLKFYRIGSRGDRRYILKDVLSFMDQSTGVYPTPAQPETS